MESLGFWDSRLYSQGYKNAEMDIQNEGIEYAERHAGNIQYIGWYTIGYRTAVDVYLERQLNG